jgi:CSLREA domain-containing protein
MSAAWPRLPLSEAVRKFGTARGRALFAGLVVTLVLVAITALKPDSAYAAAGLTIPVNDTADLSDSNPGDGLCRAGWNGNSCTLRAAIEEANASLGRDTITIAPGVYELEIPTVNDDLPGSGDFDITSPVTITGAGAADTVIDGGVPPEGLSENQRGMDRLFEIHPSAGNVTISGLTLREGFSAADGGAIENWSPGTVRLQNTRLVDNFATGVGGAVNNTDPAGYNWLVPPTPMPPSGRVEIVNSTLSGNGSGGGGAAVNNAHDGTIVIQGSTVSDNPGAMIPDPLDPENKVPAPGVYEPDNSAIVNEGEFDTAGTIVIADSDVSRNTADTDGPGVRNSGHGTLTIERSTFSSNWTHADGGAIYSVGGTLTVADTKI